MRIAILGQMVFHGYQSVYRENFPIGKSKHIDFKTRVLTSITSSVKAHPLEVFLVILIAGNLAGVGGMILAIPVYTILRVIAKEFFDQFELVRSITKDI